jgi:hypothetical protein
MKKILFSMMLAALCTSSYANDKDAKEMDAAGRNKIVPLITAAAIIYGSEQAGQYLGLTASVVKVVDLTALLMGIGITFDDPTFKDFALRAPLALGTNRVANSEYVQAVIHKLPLGIGEAIKKLDEEGRFLTAMALYEALTKPVYEKFRDDTKIGRFVVHGDGF